VGAGNLKLETGGLADVHLLADAAGAVVVGVAHKGRGVGGEDEAVFGVPTVLQHIIRFP